MSESLFHKEQMPTPGYNALLFIDRNPAKSKIKSNPKLLVDLLVLFICIFCAGGSREVRGRFAGRSREVFPFVFTSGNYLRGRFAGGSREVKKNGCPKKTNN